MRIPGNTRDGNAEEPIDPVIVNIEPCDFGAAREMMTVHYARESAALADAEHVDKLFAVEDIDQHAVANLRRFAIAVSRRCRDFNSDFANDASPAADCSWPGDRAQRLFSFDSFTNSTSPICAAS